jgi:hypothetical protein
MSRRRTLVVGIVVVCSLVTAVHVGSFTSASAERDVSVNVVSDDDAYLGLSVSGPVSIGLDDDANHGHGDGCSRYDGDNPGTSGPPRSGSRTVNLTLLVENRFARPLDVRISLGSRTDPARIHPGGAEAFPFTNVSVPRPVVVEAEGAGISAAVFRRLCG